MTAAKPKGGRRFDCGGFSGLDHLPLTLAGLRVSGTLAMIGFLQLSSRFRHGGTLLDRDILRDTRRLDRLLKAGQRAGGKLAR